jgi:hypothetical protein
MVSNGFNVGMQKDESSTDGKRAARPKIFVLASWRRYKNPVISWNLL